MRPQIVWFKRDLRVTDHRPLVHAAQAGPVLPLYIDEPQLWEQADASMRHRRFIADALESLGDDLSRLGLRLAIAYGPVENILTACRDAFGDFDLWSHEETGNGWTFARDRRVAAWCRDRGIRWHEIPQNGVIRGLRKRSGWAVRWEKRMREPLIAAPTAVLGTIEAPFTANVTDFRRRDVAWAAPLWGPATAVGRSQQRGTRASGEQVLASFLTTRGREYRFGLSSPLSAVSACSRLSPHLTFGTLSLREVVQAARARSEQIEAHTAHATAWRHSLKSFISRLHWHCHFIQKLESQPDLEFRNIHRSYDGLRENDFNEAHYSAWAGGTTGIPFIDASMRALVATGWMNFRMRAMLCSFASFHLWLHWRKPALHLARVFTDYEPGIHFSQMQMQSGTTGTNTIRMYNPVKQGIDQDPTGAFIRRWCPELAALPAAIIHEPWKLAPDELARHRIVLGENYPMPIVDHLAAARTARDAAWAVRKTTAFRRAADEIQIRHGSRKSGLPQIRQRPANATKPEDRALPLPLSFDIE